ncbi:MAG: histidinol dehydrogenase, partial [Spirochaetes bacterium]|nr:histidinol dehydrogenase [Spirochaetota bacterium]
LSKAGFKTGWDEVKKAYNRVFKKDPFYIETVNTITERIRKFHKNQVEHHFISGGNKNDITGQMINPIEKILIYVPGGNAFYPSTLLMNVIPAQCAGVKNIYVTTPMKNNNPVQDEILAVLYLLNIKQIYHIGGAQAIGAFTFGTSSIPRVYKIFGPGNIYVTLAKKMVFGMVDIDMIAGPTEVLIIADKKANPDYIALDMLAQAEHDSLAASLLVTDSRVLAQKVRERTAYFLKKYKSSTAEESIKKNGMAIIIKDIKKAFDLANKIAPEHLEILLDDPLQYLTKVKNAGSVFLGEYTPEAVGDYYAGPNHTLPTMGTAKFFSQLGVYDFIKRTGFTFFTKETFLAGKKYILKIAEKEKLKFHALSVKYRK